MTSEAATLPIPAAPPEPRPAPAPAPAPAPREPEPELKVALPQALLGMALYGFALRTGATRAAPDLGHLLWSGALPAAQLLSWLVCLPALYIFWAGRQRHFEARDCWASASAALGATGAALASTAPLLWFFAVTAPHSRLVGPLGLLFLALALLAGGLVFGRRVRERGGELAGWALWSFVGLTALTFAQFAHSTGLTWLD
jgi:hypothetical protein